MKRRAYRATDVKDLRLENVLKAAPAGNATAGLDIGKFEVRGVVRWNDGSFERPWKAASPSQIEPLVGLLRKVADSRPLVVAMESTGTYGDVVRAKLHEAGLVVHRVGGKAAHDYAEVFDGVPSQHDGKDAAVIAELTAFGKSTPWPYRAKEDADAKMAYWADWLDAQQSIQQLWTGRLESLLARHWPEATRLLDLASVTLLSTLAHYGGPAKLAGDPAASARLARWGRGGLEGVKIERLLASASQTVGVPQAWAVDRAKVDVLRGDAHEPVAVGASLVRREEGEGQGPWQGGVDRDSSQVGVGPVFGRSPRGGVRASAAVFESKTASQGDACGTAKDASPCGSPDRGVWRTWGLRPQTPGIYRIGAKDQKEGRRVAPPLILGPGRGARVGSHRSPILRTR